MPRFRDQAIVLRVREWSETSQIAVMLCAQRGKVRGLAKGSMRMSPSSVQRFSGGFEMLTRGEVLCRTRPNGELASITEWDLQKTHPRLRENLAAQWLAMYAAELSDALMADLDPHPLSFAGLGLMLDGLDQQTSANLRPSLDNSPNAHGRLRSGQDHGALHSAHRHLLAYQWTLLDECGYRPELKQDVHGGGALANQPTYAFDPLAGGLTSGSTRGPDQGGTWGVRKQTVNLLRRIAAGDGETVWLENTNLAIVQRANRLLAAYARTILDRDLPTMRLL